MVVGRNPLIDFIKRGEVLVAQLASTANHATDELGKEGAQLLEMVVAQLASSANHVKSELDKACAQLLESVASKRATATKSEKRPNDYKDADQPDCMQKPAHDLNDTQKQPDVKLSQLHGDEADQTNEIEKRSIGKVLNAGNVIAMALHADTGSLDTCSAKLLKEACLELIAREWNTVYDSYEWKELEQEVPKLAADLAFRAVTLTDAHEKFKEACIKLIIHMETGFYDSAVWKELKKAKPEFAFHLAEDVAAAVLTEKK